MDVISHLFSCWWHLCAEPMWERWSL